MPQEKDTPVFHGFGEMDHLVGLHIALAHGTVYRHFTESLSHLELTQKQATMLWLVDEHAGIAQTDIAKLMRMDRATTMAIVNRLQARDFLVRGKSKTDRRRQTIDLLPEGKKVLELAKLVIAEHEEWLKDKFKTRDIDRFVSMLKTVYEK